MKDILRLMRPKQWTKNAFVFAALIFSGELFNRELLIESVLAFFVFCLISSSVYIINDIVDRDSDRLHPKKKERPIASGKVSVPMAMVLFFILFAVSAIGAVLLSTWFAILVAIYFIINIAYSFKLKKVPILDILCVASGYIIRALAGALLIEREISPWLLICAFFLALFLATHKRSSELKYTDRKESREVMKFYNKDMLRDMSATIDSGTIIAYALYTFNDYKLSYMMLTIPFVIYGIFRYQYIIHSSELAETPEIALLRDKPLLIDIVLWIIACAVIIYAL